MNFSHIYVEPESHRYPITETILSQFPQSTIIPIPHYKAIFNRPYQKFHAQKSAMSLILAVKRRVTLYKGADKVQNFHEPNLFYTDQIRNCAFNCSYCFLQGMHKTANILIFVNTEDFFSAVEALLKKKGSAYVSISYLTDLLGFENLIPLNHQWLEFAHTHPAVSIETRTKSSNLLQGFRPSNNFILVWSMSPSSIAKRHEKGCASLPSRIFHAYQAARSGWKIRLVFDPVLLVEDWRKKYDECFSQVFSRISPSLIDMVSLGIFRMHPSQLHAMQEDEQSDVLLHKDYHESGKLVSYPPADIKEAKEYLTDALRKFLPIQKIKVVPS